MIDREAPTELALGARDAAVARGARRLVGGDRRTAAARRLRERDAHAAIACGNGGDRHNTGPGRLDDDRARGSGCRARPDAVPRRDRARVRPPGREVVHDDAEIGVAVGPRRAAVARPARRVVRGDRSSAVGRLRVRDAHTVVARRRRGDRRRARHVRPDSHADADADSDPNRSERFAATTPAVASANANTNENPPRRFIGLPPHLFETAPPVSAVYPQQSVVKRFSFGKVADPPASARGRFATEARETSTCSCFSRVHARCDGSSRPLQN